MLHKISLYSLRLLLNTFSASANIWRAVLKMDAERFFNSSCTLPIVVCQTLTKVSLGCQFSVRLLGTFTKNREKRLLVCLSARMKHLGSHWTVFREICILSIWWEGGSIEKVQIPLISDKNNGCFKWRQKYACNNI